MLGVLPILFVACAFLAMGAGSPRPRSLAAAPIPRRDAFLLAMLAGGAWAALGGEALGIVSGLTFWPVLAWWGAPTCAACAFAFGRRGMLRAWLSPATHPDRVTFAFVGAVAVLLLTTGVTALLTPPNTWDSLMYHLPRQVIWMQQGSLAHFPAHDLRQIEFPPMAESASVQMMILAGGAGSPAGWNALANADQWANMVQWGAYFACVLAASVIARDLGSSGRGQAVSALLVAALPPAVQQAVNAKNDLVVALWVCLLMWLALRVRKDRACGPGLAALIGLTLGLLLYTKGTAYILALPLGALLGVWLLGAFFAAVDRGSSRLGAAAGASLGAALIVIVGAGVNAGHWLRNYDAFGHPLGQSAAGRGYKLANQTAAPSAIISNLARNLVLHTQTPSEQLNLAQERWVRRLHEALGIAINDPRTSSSERTTYSVRWTLDQDGCAPAPFHLLLAVVAPVWLVAPRRRAARIAETPGPCWGILGAGLGAFLIFCVVLKWQPWHARLHIPIFILLAPVCGLLLSRAPGGPAKGVFLLGAVVLAAGAALVNNAKPLVGDHSVFRSTREDMLFRHETRTRDATHAAIAAAAEFAPRVVGLTPGWSGVDYPMQRAVMDRLKPRPRLVTGRINFGPQPPPGEPDPEVILAWHATGATMSFRPGARGYVSVAQTLPVTVYAKDELVRTKRRQIEDMPFMGWRALEGLGPLEGPYPRGNLPVVRWATERRTRLEFSGAGRAPELVLECRRAAATDQTMVVLLNGRPIYRFEVGPAWEFTAHRIALHPRPGPNEIEIRYGTIDELPDGRRRAVLFRKIQIIPGEQPPPPP